LARFPDIGMNFPEVAGLDRTSPSMVRRRSVCVVYGDSRRWPAGMTPSQYERGKPLNAGERGRSVFVGQHDRHEHVAHLAEINDSQGLGRRRSIEVLDEVEDRPKGAPILRSRRRLPKATRDASGNSRDHRADCVKAVLGPLDAHSGALMRSALRLWRTRRRFGQIQGCRFADSQPIAPDENFLSQISDIIPCDGGLRHITWRAVAQLRSNTTLTICMWLSQRSWVRSSARRTRWIFARVSWVTNPQERRRSEDKYQLGRDAHL
jgi:hypothetical protein